MHNISASLLVFTKSWSRGIRLHIHPAIFRRAVFMSLLLHVTKGLEAVDNAGSLATARSPRLMDASAESTRPIIRSDGKRTERC